LPGLIEGVLKLLIDFVRYGAVYFGIFYTAVPRSPLIAGAEISRLYGSRVPFLFVLLRIGNVYFTR
jgi:hypothetical protein